MRGVARGEEGLLEIGGSDKYLLVVSYLGEFLDDCWSCISDIVNILRMFKFIFKI